MTKEEAINLINTSFVADNLKMELVKMLETKTIDEVFAIFGDYLVEDMKRRNEDFNKSADFLDNGIEVLKKDFGVREAKLDEEFEQKMSLLAADDFVAKGKLRAEHQEKLDKLWTDHEQAVKDLCKEFILKS